MITMITHVRVNPDNAPAYEALMTDVCAKVRAHEPGVAYYAFGRSVDDPDTYAVIEVYRDAAAHAAHMATDWVRESLPKSSRLIEGQYVIRQYVSPGAAPVLRRKSPLPT
jgi:quinol monooxygenase YgiN